MTTINDILLAKGTHVHTILESATVLDAVQQMNKHRVGCLVVTRESCWLSRGDPRRRDGNRDCR
jgi:predicted transcriptional regulator